jgi:hypothetical protein
MVQRSLFWHTVFLIQMFHAYKLLSPIVVDNSVKNYDELGLSNIPIVKEDLDLAGIDPGFGSSNTGIVITGHLRNTDIVRVIFSEEYEKTNPLDIIDLCWQFHRQFD